jgi:hypothetical protein
MRDARAPAPSHRAAAVRHDSIALKENAAMTLARPLPALLAVLASTGPAHALDAGGAKLVVDKFLASQPQDQGTPDAFAQQIADVNGDGKPDIVLVWNVMGPTSAWPKLTLFLDNGRSYRALTTDLQGQVEKLDVKGPNIVVTTLMPGPNDARCCPTRKTRIDLRWQNGKLMQLK